jgi:hypothetical protein
MQNKFVLVLLVILLGMGCLAGCSSSAPIATPTSQIVYITVLVTPTPQASRAATTPAIVMNNTTASTDPIIHRYIRQYSGLTTGYEFKFYPEGTVDYREGTIKEISGNFMIDTVSLEASGTWTNLGNMVYLVKILPTGQSGAQIIRQYTLVPAHEEKDYPGVVITEHIESSYETNAINLGQQRSSNIMYYPERVKID